MAIYNPRREVSRETSPAHTLISDFQLLGLGGKNFLMFKATVMLLSHSDFGTRSGSLL